VTEQPEIMKPGQVPHHGPVGRSCPLDCLQTVLSLMTLHRLARAYDAPFDPPQTIGQVIELYAGGRLHQIRGLGQRRIGEIEVALVLAGIDITRDLSHARSVAEQEADNEAEATELALTDRLPPCGGSSVVNPGGGGALWRMLRRQRSHRSPCGGRGRSAGSHPR
jgi:hypothetical protein